MRTRRFTRKLQRLQPLALASLLALGASGLNAAPRSFVGPGSFWDVVANWTGGVLPGVGDDVLLGGFDTTVRSNFSINSFSGTGTLSLTGGTLSIAASSVTGNFVQTSGVLAGAGDLLITGSASFSGGGMVGPGQTRVDGLLTMSNFAGFALDEGRLLLINGGAVFSNNSINLNPGNTGNAAAGRIVNAAGSTITDNSSSGTHIFTQNFGAPDNGASASFTNAGSYNKTGSGTSTIGANFINSGSVNVGAGSLVLSGGGTHTGASFSGAGTLNFGGGVHTLDATSSLAVQQLGVSSGTLNLAGSVNVGSSTTVNGGTLNLTAPVASLGTALNISGGLANLGGQNLTVASFSQSGGGLTGSDQFTVTGTSAWGGGSMAGSGETHFNGALALGNFAGMNLDEGRTVFIHAGATLSNNGINLNPGNTGNAAAGRIVNAAGSTITDNSSSGSSIFTQNFGAPDNGASASFSNLGTYTKTGTGTSTLNANFLNSGTVNVDGGGLALTGNSTHTGATLTGAGTLSFSGGVHSLDASSVISTQNLSFTGGTTTVAGIYNVAGTSTFSGGVVNLPAVITSLGQNLVINGGTANLGSNSATVVNFTQSGGVLAGSGNLTVSGVVTLSGGQMLGSGQTVLNAPLAMNNFAGLGLDEGRTLLIAGGATLGNNSFNLNPGNTGNAAAGRIVNAAGSTISDNSSSGTSIFTQNFGGADNGASASFTNLGTYTKTGAGTSNIAAPALNSGTVNIDGGGLLFSGSSSHTGATLTGAGTLSFSGGVHDVDASSTISTGQVTVGGGSVTLAGSYDVAGTTTVNGGSVAWVAPITRLGAALVIGGGEANLGSNDASVNSYTQTGGVLRGSGRLTVPGGGTVVLGGGQMVGSGETLFNTTASFNNFAGIGLDEGRTLVFAGNASLSNNSINLNPGNSGNAAAGRIVNAAGSTLTDSSTSGSSIFTQNFGGADNGASASFSNLGIYTKTGAGSSTISVPFNNAGSVNVNAGSLALSATSSHTGSLQIAAGALLNLGGGTHNLGNPAAVANSGTLQLSSGVLNLAGPLNSAGLVLLTGGSFNAGSANHQSASFNQSSGVLSGSGDFTVSGNTTLSGGTMLGSGRTVLNGALALNNFSGIGVDEGRTLVVTGGASFSNNSFNLNPGNTGNAAAGRIVNAAGSTISDNSSSGSNLFTQNFGGADNGASASFTNAGSYIKTGSGTSTISVSFSNAGQVAVNGGTLALTGSSSHEGSLQIASGAVLNFGGGTHTLNNPAAVNNAGTLLLSSGSLNPLGDLHSASLLSITSGTFNGGAATHQTASFNQSGGTLNGSGDFIVSGNSTLSGGSMLGTGRTVLNGALSLGNSSGLHLDEGRTLLIAGGATFNNNSFNLNPGNSGDAAAGRIVNAAGSTITDASTSGSNLFTQNFGGVDNGASASFSNLGLYDKTGAGTTSFNLNFINDGRVNGAAGTLVLARGVSGTGTLATADNGSVRVDANSFVGTLLNNGSTATALNLQGNTVTVALDYDNASFGSGNSFNRRANVASTGTGPRILAAGDVNQALAGAQLANGSTSAPTLSFGNVHVGSTTRVYQIVNVGSSGPALRGALQTAVNGANVSDARLSGSGVTAGNWGPVAAGGTLQREVTLTVADAGVYAPLSGQAVNVLNNFENTRSQLLTINSSAGAAAYHLATAASVTPNPVQLANQRVGMALSGALTVANTAPAGSFTEGLNASFGNFSGHAAGNGGSVQLLAAGSSNHTAMALLLDTSTAGAKSGTAQLLFTSDGSGSSGLGLTALGTQTVAISGDVYRLASAGLATPSPVVLLDQRVGGTLTQALNLSNTAPADGYSEGLNASISASGSATAAGAFSLLAAGGSSSALHVGVDTGSAGAKSGQALITLASDGSGTSGFGALALGTQTVNVSGNVYRLAVPVVDTTPLRLVGRVGDATLQAQIAVSNNAPDLFTERLNASIASAPAGTNAGPALLGLLPNASGQLALSLPTGTAGSFSGAVGVALVSSSAGTTSGAPDASLGTVNVGLDARIYAPAVAQLPVTVVNFGTVRVGDTVAARNVAVGNSASGALTDTLHASISGGGAPFSSSGSVVGLAAGASNSSALMVQLATATAGVFNSAATVQLRSQNPDLPDLALASMNVQLQGQVNHIASATLAQAGGGGTFSGTAFSYTLDFGTLLLDGGTVTSTLSLANAATGTADALAGSWNLATLAGGPFSAAGFEAFTGLAAGSQLGGLTVSFSSGTEGSFNRTVVLNGLSTNGSGPDLALNPITLQLQGTVVAVPEPGTYLMMAVGVLMMGSIARRKLRAQHLG